VWCPRPDLNRHDPRIEGFSCPTRSPGPKVTLETRGERPSLRSGLSHRPVSHRRWRHGEAWGVGRVVSEGPATASLLIACTAELSPEWSRPTTGVRRILRVPSIQPDSTSGLSAGALIGRRRSAALFQVPCVYQFHHSGKQKYGVGLELDAKVSLSQRRHVSQRVPEAGGRSRKRTWLLHLRPQTTQHPLAATVETWHSHP
jgi:hypothetical protein